MQHFKTNYKRILPHIQPIGATFFVTIRLFDTLPKSYIADLDLNKKLAILAIKDKKLEKIKEKEAIDKIEGQFLLQFDNALDKIQEGQHYLKNHDIAQIIIDKLKEYDNKYYCLVAFCIMSNHVHVLLDFSAQLPSNELTFDENSYIQLDKVLQLIKGGSANKANKMLNRKGSFWARESFDRYIRNEKHRNIVINYILNNPVSAGICKDWKDYPFSYVKHFET